MSGVVRDCEQVPERRIGNDSAAVRDVIDARDGCELFTLRTIRAVAPQHRPRHRRERGAAVRRERSGSIVTASGEHAVESEPAAAGPGDHYEFVNAGPDDILAVRSRCTPAPALAPPPRCRGSPTRPRSRRPPTGVSHRLRRRQRLPCGNPVRGVHPRRAAPPHYHLYDEVIYVLDGHGVMHMGGEQTPLRAGSAISLPRARSTPSPTAVRRDAVLGVSARPVRRRRRITRMARRRRLPATRRKQQFQLEVTVPNQTGRTYT